MNDQTPREERSFVDQCVAAATLKIAVDIEEIFCRLMGELRLPYDLTALKVAQQAYLDTSPLYVKTIVICGELQRDMYDDHPGFAYFFSNATRPLAVPPYCRLQQGMLLGLEAFKAAEIESENALDEDGEGFDGHFSPRYLLLLDQFNGVLQEYWPADSYQDREGWVAEPASAQDWEKLRQSVFYLRSNAAEEAGWDNFSTADDLRERARGIQRRLEISRSWTRVIY